jgi:SprT protein
MSHYQPILDAIENAFIKAEQAFGRKFERCSIRMDIQANSGRAGTASIAPRRLIRINPTIYRNHPQHVVNETCPHEVAHLVAFDLYGRSGWGHGRGWKNVMRAIGQKPERCHNLLVQKDLNKPIYECSRCKKQAIVGPTAHRRVQGGLARLRACSCGGNYSFLDRAHVLLKNKQLTCRELPNQ